MKLKIWIGVLVFLILVNLATIGSFIYFQMNDHPRHNPAFSGRPPSEIFHIDREKRRQLFDLFRKYREETREQEQEVHKKEQELFDLLQQNPTPMDQVEEKIQEITQLRAIVGHKMVEAMIEAKTFLTPEEQRHFFNAMLRARPGKFEKHRPGFKRGGPRPPMFDPEFR